jgi:CDP-diacylglycerol--serine O-phosphatidyltransferase
MQPLGVVRYTIPNAFTALSLLLGLGSIVTTQVGELEFAAWIIVWCGLLDTIDGLAARLLKATSNFGAEFDSMADLVSFGVAPAVLVFNAGLQLAGIEIGSGQFWVLLTACGIFVLGGAMRLARFNLSTDQPRGWFTGVPITGAGGGLVASMILVLIQYEDIASLLPLHRYLPIAMFVLAILMVSRLRFPKAVIRKSKLHNIFMFANVVAILYCAVFRVFPEYLFFMGLILLVSGIIAGRISRET